MRTTAAFLALTVMAATHAGAQTRLTFIPSLSLGAVYDDNVFARVDGSAGKMLQLRPSFEGNFETPRLTWLGLYSFDAQRSNFSSLNTLDARRHALTTLRVRSTPMTTLSLSGRYDRSETPGEIDFDTGILGDRRTAERWQVTPSMTQRLNTRAVFSAGYDYVTENLVDGEAGTLHTGRLGLGRELSERTSVTGYYMGRYFDDGLENHTSHSALLGYDRELAAGTRFTLQAGPRSTSYRGVAPEVAVGFSRTTPYIRLNLDYWHGETIILGIRGPIAVDGANARVTWPFGRRLEFGAHAGLSDIATLDDRESRIYRGTLVSSWTTGGMLTVAASYGIDYQQGDVRRFEFRNDDVLRHVFRVSLTVAPRLSRSILPPEEAARTKGVMR